jgi:acetate---CoA ligase (ADP-forming)
VVGISGGACELAADLAEESGVALPVFTDQTRQNLRTLLPVIGPANNPLDTTGAAVNNLTLMGSMLDAVSQDPQLDILFCMMDPPGEDTPASRSNMERLVGIGQALKRSPLPAFILLYR